MLSCKRLAGLIPGHVDSRGPTQGCEGIQVCSVACLWVPGMVFDRVEALGVLVTWSASVSDRADGLDPSQSLAYMQLWSLASGLRARSLLASTGPALHQSTQLWSQDVRPAASRIGPWWCERVRTFKRLQSFEVALCCMRPAESALVPWTSSDLHKPIFQCSLALWQAASPLGLLSRKRASSVTRLRSYETLLCGERLPDLVRTRLDRLSPPSDCGPSLRYFSAWKQQARSLVAQTFSVLFELTKM